MPASSMTVTATQDRGGVANGMLLRVIVLTGASSLQNGGVKVAATFASPCFDQSVTTTVTNSRVYGVTVDWDAATTFTADAATTYIDNVADGTNGVRYGTFKATALTGTPGATTLGASAPTAKAGCYAAVEILSDGTLLWEDVSAPAVLSDFTAQTLTTASFTPAPGALLLALVATNSNSSAAPGSTVSGGGLTWLNLETAFGIASTRGGADIWVASVPPEDPADPVITAQQGGSTGAGMAMRIKVLTGARAAALQTATPVTQSSGTAAAHQASITTTVTNSIVYGAVIGGSSTTFTAAASTTLLDNITDATHGECYGTCRTTAATGTPGAVTVGTSAPSSSGGVALFEILPSGTIAEDASAPAVASTLSATSVSCVNFFPPAGSLLVALVSSDGSGAQTTMTVSGGGLTWIEKAHANVTGADYAGVWIADYVTPAIAHDVTTAGVDYTSTGTQTTSHAANAAARAAVVMIDQNGTTTDEVSGVTYGGQAMTRLRSDTEATEAGRTYIYWLDGIAGGTQNVAMTTTAATSKQLVAATMLTDAGRAVAVAGHNTGTSTSIANPSWTITGLTAGTLVAAYEVIHSGLTTMTTTPATGWTLITSTDLGAAGRGFANQQTAPAGTTLACGWTAVTADDFVGSSVAFYALPPAAPPDVIMAPRIAP